MGGFIILAAWIGVIAILVVRLYTGTPSSYALLPHQQGILHRRGVPVREVGPGKHRVWTGVEKIFFLDTRPIQVYADDRAVALQDGYTAVYGFSATAEVRDVRKVLYSAAIFSQVPACVLLCSARAALNGCTRTQVLAYKEASALEISTRAKTRLAAAGFELTSFRMNQLVVAPPQQEDSEPPDFDA
jgi:hypothetical protein